MDLSYFKEIFDPIYGFIKLTQDEIKIVDNLIFQRLHNINQLGALHMVFPMARNTRFSHSLGVLAITSKIIDNLRQIKSDYRKIKKFQIVKRDLKLIRAAALMHDIGHLPFSHCTENVIRDYLIKKLPDIRSKIKKKFHEWLGGEIIKKTDIYDPSGQDSDIIKQNRDNISQIIQGTSGFTMFNQMVHSELDIDRLDYLIRDSYSTGISFGQIDLEQILRKMYVYERGSTGRPYTDNIIVYSTQAINSIDNFYFARIFMFNSVYFHKVKCYFEYLLSESYRLMITSENLDLLEDILPTKPDVILSPILKEKQLSKEEIQDFYIEWHKFDDYYLWNCMRNCWHELRTINNEELHKDLKLLKIYLDLLFQRKKSELVWELNRLKSVIDDEEKKIKALDSILGPILDELESWINVELAKEYDSPLIVLNQKVEAPLTQDFGDIANPNDHQSERTLFFNPKTNEFHYLNNVESSINFQTNRSEFRIFRVFCPDKKYGEELNIKIKIKYNELITSSLEKEDDKEEET